MTTRSRILLAVVSLSLVVTFFTPLWRIELEAPQYPEGLGLRIMLHTVKGQKPQDLNNINNLNHYIGMKRIEPDAIPELRIMPWAIAFLIGFGLVTAASGKPGLLYAWTGIFLVLAVAGLVDFWLWEYDYGHDLDLEHAAIKVPGMSYQPPLIGSKKLLNFTAHSWPDIGGWTAILAAGMGVLLSWQSLRRRAFAAPVAAVLALAVLGGCSPAPEPFRFGTDRDEFCRMTITDERFAGQVVRNTGKVLKFDSIECMGRYMQADLLEPGAVHGIWVSLFDEPGTIVPSNEADFLFGASISSPMGGGLAAVRAGAPIPDGWAEVERLDWEGVLALLAAAPMGAHH